MGCGLSELPILLTDMPRDSAPISTSQRSDGLGRVEVSCAASRHLFSSLSWERRRKGGEFHPLGAGGGEKEAVRYVKKSRQKCGWWSGDFSPSCFSCAAKPSRQVIEL